MRTARRMFSATSFGVFCRSAPSTRAIMRSRNVCPGSDVTRTLIQSEMTRVPPVTADRSPPDSRITGADSPVIADSSTDATPSMISPSAGMNSPACTMTTSSLRSVAAGTLLRLSVVRQPVRHGFGSRFPKRLGLRFASAFGHRLGEVRKEDGKPQPEGDLPREKRPSGARSQFLDEHDRGENGCRPPR